MQIKQLFSRNGRGRLYFCSTKFVAQQAAENTCEISVL